MMKSFIAACLCALATADAQVTELTSKDTRDRLFKENDFNVLSMYRKSDKT